MATAEDSDNTDSDTQIRVREALFNRAAAILGALESQLLSRKKTQDGSDNAAADVVDGDDNTNDQHTDQDADGINDFDTVECVEELNVICRSLTLRAKV